MMTCQRRYDAAFDADASRVEFIFIMVIWD